MLQGRSPSSSPGQAAQCFQAQADAATAWLQLQQTRDIFAADSRPFTEVAAASFGAGAASHSSDSALSQLQASTDVISSIAVAASMQLQQPVATRSHAQQPNASAAERLKAGPTQSEVGVSSPPEASMLQCDGVESSTQHQIVLADMPTFTAVVHDHQVDAENQRPAGMLQLQHAEQAECQALAAHLPQPAVQLDSIALSAQQTCAPEQLPQLCQAQQPALAFQPADVPGSCCMESSSSGTAHEQSGCASNLLEQPAHELPASQHTDPQFEHLSAEAHTASAVQGELNTISMHFKQLNPAQPEPERQAVRPDDPDAQMLSLSPTQQQAALPGKHPETELQSLAGQSADQHEQLACRSQSGDEHLTRLEIEQQPAAAQPGDTNLYQAGAAVQGAARFVDQALPAEAHQQVCYSQPRESQQQQQQQQQKGEASILPQQGDDWGTDPQQPRVEQQALDSQQHNLKQQVDTASSVEAQIELPPDQVQQIQAEQPVHHTQADHLNQQSDCNAIPPSQQSELVHEPMQHRQTEPEKGATQQPQPHVADRQILQHSTASAASSTASIAVSCSTSAIEPHTILSTNSRLQQFEADVCTALESQIDLQAGLTPEDLDSASLLGQDSAVVRERSSEASHSLQAHSSSAGLLQADSTLCIGFNSDEGTKHQREEAATMSGLVSSIELCM